MNWYKIANEPRNWKDVIEEVHKKRARLRREAEEKGSKLGHFLDGWNTSESCHCRKCGAYAKINGVLSDIPYAGPQFYGSAFINPCNVNFSTPYEFSKFESPNPKDALV